jgi:hypothetical protein
MSGISKLLVSSTSSFFSDVHAIYNDDYCKQRHPEAARVMESNLAIHTSVSGPVAMNLDVCCILRSRKSERRARLAAVQAVALGNAPDPD